MDDYGNDWINQLLRETHEYVDEQRAVKGLPPWTWHRPQSHRVPRSLESLLRVIEEDGTMRDYSCRSMCGFVGDGPTSIHEHYSEHPDHKISPYEAKKLREGKTTKPSSSVSAQSESKPKRQYKPRVNSHARELMAFEQLHALKDKFAAEINAEEAAIHRMESEAAARRTQLTELRSTYDVLEKATAGPQPERPEFHETVAGMVMEGLGRTE